MGENFVDFRAIKQLVSMRAVLDRYRIQLRQVNQHSLRGRCPLPTHSSERSSESFGVDLGKNIWACQSTSCAAARQGKKGGNVIDFVAVMESCSVRDAALKLRDWFSGSASHGAAANPIATGEQTKLVAEIGEAVRADREVNPPLSFTLSKIDHAHPYLRDRGISLETAEHFGVGFFPGRGSMSGRIVIPIHNEAGELVAYAGRAIDDSEPKYRFPTGFKKSLELFNLHRVGECERVIVVEGFFDCMQVHLAGLPCVALMGSSLSEHQEHMLIERFGMVTLLLDGDDAGRKATEEIANRLNRKVHVRVVDLPDGRQADQLSAAEIEVLLN